MSFISSDHSSVLSVQSAVLHGAVGNAVAALIYPALGHRFLRLDSVHMAAHPGFGSQSRISQQADDLADIIDDYMRLMVQDDGIGLLGAIHSGYLASTDQAEMLARKIADIKTQAQQRHSVTPLYLLDPVLGDDARFYVDPDIAQIMRDDLIPLADILTPNQFELSVLTGQPCDSLDKVMDGARLLLKHGPTFCFVTGCVEGDHSADVLVTPDNAYQFTYEKRDSGVSGAGDALAALFLALYLSGADYDAAAAQASKATQYLIKKATDSRSLPLFNFQDVTAALNA